RKSGHPCFVNYVSVLPLLFPGQKILIPVVFAVHVACMTYDCVNTQTNPDLSNAMQRLEHAFLMCREQIKKGKRLQCVWWHCCRN
uniref:Uncharacterized protein n=1 Tax=Ficedula albicollis TaxID=59894 RepID=A0A803WDN0_FICAL